MGAEGELDHLGRRRLGARETAGWYAAAFVTYVAAGIWQKFLLNWIVGPLWLVAFTTFGPVLLDRLRRRTP